MKILDSWIGQRVELHPGTDRWIAGDKYGTVAKIGRIYVHVRMDRSGKTVKADFDRITFV